MFFDAQSPGNLEFFGPQMALINWLDAISQDPRNVSARIKNITLGAV